MANNVIICTDNKELIIEYLYTVEQHLTFHIKVKSDSFAGESGLCISKEDLFNVIEKLSKMYNELKGSCDIMDYDSDGYLIIEMLSLGHMSMSGQIGGTHADHCMKFKFLTDQTVLERLIRIFTYALKQNKDADF